MHPPFWPTSCSVNTMSSGSPAETDVRIQPLPLPTQRGFSSPKSCPIDLSWSCRPGQAALVGKLSACFPS